MSTPKHPKTTGPRVGKALSAILSSARSQPAADADDDGNTPDAEQSTTIPVVSAESHDTGAMPRLAEPFAQPAAAAPAPPASRGNASRSEPHARKSSVAPAQSHATAASTPSHNPATATAAEASPRATEVAYDTGTADVVAPALRKRETFLVPIDLAEEMRDAIVHLAGPPVYLTLASFGEEAIRSYLERLKREHNRGQPFPRRPRPVRQGRPIR